MALFQNSEIQCWDRFYRANFINSLTGFKSVSLIGAADKAGQTNLSKLGQSNFIVLQKFLKKQTS